MLELLVHMVAEDIASIGVAGQAEVSLIRYASTGDEDASAAMTLDVHADLFDGDVRRRSGRCRDAPRSGTHVAKSGQTQIGSELQKLRADRRTPEIRASSGGGT